MADLDSPLRLAVIATPRCGNTWLRLLLSNLLNLETMAVHAPDEVPWSRLPPRFVFQLHWHQTADFAEQLRYHGVRVLGIHRHPLDTLISILHASLHDCQSEFWLDGDGGSEESIVAAMPRSQAFLEYCTGTRAARLFGIATEWSDYPGRIEVGYENLVAQPELTLARLLQQLGKEPARPIAGVVAEHSLTHLKRLHHGHNHFWLGRPGLWHSLLCTEEAEQIRAALKEHFHRHEYFCDPDRSLTPALADANWLDLVRHERKRDSAEAHAARTKLGQTQRELKTIEHQAMLLRIQVQTLTADKLKFERAGARPLNLLLRWASFRDRHPRLVRILKRCFERPASMRSGFDSRSQIAQQRILSAPLESQKPAASPVASLEASVCSDPGPLVDPRPREERAAGEAWCHYGLE